MNRNIGLMILHCILIILSIASAIFATDKLAMWLWIASAICWSGCFLIDIREYKHDKK